MGIKLSLLKSDIKNQTSHSVSYLLNNEVRDTVSYCGIKGRKVISPLLLKAYKKETDYKIVIDSREELPKTKKGKIFVVNHRQADDIVIGANVIKENGYILFGNPTLALETKNGLGLWLNGVILINRDDKTSTQASLEKMEYILNHGGNIIIWAEGYWNLDDNGLSDKNHKTDDHNSESWLIQDLHIGVFKLAQKLGVLMVPTILHYDEFSEKTCYGRRGTHFCISKEDDVFAKKDEFKEIMQSDYYELMRKYSIYARGYLEENGKTIKEQWEELKKELIKACDIERINYHLDLEDEKLIGKAKVVKEIITNEEVFGHLKDIQYDKSNTFLKSKRLTGLR